MKLLCSRIPTSDWSLDNPCPATYVDIDGNCCKKLSISAAGVSKKLRRVSRMGYQNLRSLEEVPAAFSLWKCQPAPRIARTLRPPQEEASFADYPDQDNHG
jgi:hypothetical protein